MTMYKRAIGLFYSRNEAEEALRAIKDSGFNMKRVNLIARDADKVNEAAGIDTEQKDNNAPEGAGAGATSGAVLGGLGGLLVGIGTLAIPGVGPIILAGEAGTAIATTLAGAGIGAAAGGLVGALVGLGIPEERAKMYNERVKGGSYLVIVEGTEDEINRAEAILNNHGIEEFEIYDAPDMGNADTIPVNTTETRVTPETRTVPKENLNTIDNDPDVIIVEKREDIR